MISGFSQINQIFRNTKGSWTFEDKISIEKINSYNVLMGGNFKKWNFFEHCENENQEKYIEILETCLIPMQEALFPEGYFVYYQDNASPHKTMDGNKNTLFSSIFM